MTALTVEKKTPVMLGDPQPPDLYFPVKGATKILTGALVALSAGYATKGATATGLKAAGRAEQTVDNTSGNDGDLSISVRRGVFKFLNSAGGDAIAQADVGSRAYIVDDQTVAKTDNNGARSEAGTILQVDSDGVWVEVGIVLPLAPRAQLMVIPVDLPSVAAGDIVSHVMPFRCRIRKMDFVVAKPVTTGAKAATLTPKNGANAFTGGALALTSADCTPIGAEVATATPITAGNEFAAGDTFKVTASAVTAFVEGNGFLLLHIEQLG